MKPVPTLLLALALTLSAAAQSVSVGMAEADLLKLKGTPQTKAAIGKKAILRWPDMQVTLVDGKVQSFQLRDVAAEREAEAARLRAAAERQATEKAAARERVADSRDALAEARRDAAATNRATEERLLRAASLRQQISSIEAQLAADDKRSSFKGTPPMSAEARAYLNLRLDTMRRELADLR